MAHIWNSHNDMVLAKSDQTVWNTIHTLTITKNFDFVCPPNLTELVCWSVRLKTLPSLPDTLLGLFCGGNDLIKLPKLPPKLQDLYCEFNDRLIELPILPESLRVLHCSDCESLKILPKLPVDLQELYCSTCNIDSLSTLPYDLKKLHCQRNNLTKLPHLPDSLELLYCNSNKLLCLPKLPPNLHTLFSHGNPFEPWYSFKELLDDAYFDSDRLSKYNTNIFKMNALLLNQRMMSRPQILLYNRHYQKVEDAIVKLIKKVPKIVIEI